MTTTKDTFLLDTNSIITPNRSYYSFKIAPSFWTFLQSEIVNGNLVIMDVVAQEISKGKDTLADWLKAIDITPLDRRSPDILGYYAKVLTHIQTDVAYSDRALALWSENSHADPWIVATAAARKYTIITFEQPNPALRTNHSTNKPKIPDISASLGVKCINLYQYLKHRNFSFTAYTNAS